VLCYVRNMKKFIQRLSYEVIENAEKRATRQFSATCFQALVCRAGANIRRSGG